MSYARVLELVCRTPRPWCYDILGHLSVRRVWARSPLRLSGIGFLGRGRTLRTERGAGMPHYTPVSHVGLDHTRLLDLRSCLPIGRRKCAKRA